MHNGQPACHLAVQFAAHAQPVAILFAVAVKEGAQRNVARAFGRAKAVAGKVLQCGIEQNVVFDRIVMIIGGARRRGRRSTRATAPHSPVPAAANRIDMLKNSSIFSNTLDRNATFGLSLRMSPWLSNACDRLTEFTPSWIDER
jgi:hypothetical protein